MPSFAALQAALSEERSEGLVFFAFDLLVEGKEDCRELPLTTRKARLKALLEEADVATRCDTSIISTPPATTCGSRPARWTSKASSRERLDAPYVSGRNGGWTKAKCRAGHEVVLGGWTTEPGGLRSLLAGVHRDGRLDYVGRIGTGFGEKVARQLLPTLKNLTSEVSPFSGKDAPPKEHDIRWLKPELVAEIGFAGDGYQDDSARLVQGLAPRQACQRSCRRTVDAGT